MKGTPMDKKLHDQGLENRKEVLGADYVKRSMSQVDDFNRELQEVLNEYCWGKIWSGKGSVSYTHLTLPTKA